MHCFTVACVIAFEVAVFALMLFRIVLLLSRVWNDDLRFVRMKHEQCVVCLASGTDCALDCGHYFHWKCATRWLRVNNTCPICRKPQAKAISAGCGSAR